LVRIPSSLRLASRPVMVWLLTHSLRVPIKVRVVCSLTQTATTEEFALTTLCDPFHIVHSGGRKTSFFYLNKNKNHGKTLGESIIK
jgi:hypothetical protein